MGVSPTSIPRRRLGYLPTHRIYDNLLVTDKLLKYHYETSKQCHISISKEGGEA